MSIRVLFPASPETFAETVATLKADRWTEIETIHDGQMNGIVVALLRRQRRGPLGRFRRNELACVVWRGDPPF